MNEQELGKALLNHDPMKPIAPPDIRQLSASVISRDRRRIRWLTGLTVFFWLLAAVGMPLFFFLIRVFIEPKLRHIGMEISRGKEIPANVLGSSIDLFTQVIVTMGTVLFTSSVVAILLAALCTLWLIFSMRRAMLRQVNASLLEVSEQLRDLRAALSK